MTTSDEIEAVAKAMFEQVESAPWERELGILNGPKGQRYLSQASHYRQLAETAINTIDQRRSRAS